MRDFFDNSDGQGQSPNHSNTPGQPPQRGPGATMDSSQHTFCVHSNARNAKPTRQGSVPQPSSSVGLSAKTAILAGNMRIAIDGSGRVVVEPQIMAFEAALVHAVELRDKTGELPALSVAFDHQGIFRQQFLALGLTNGQKRNPHLDQLHPAVAATFGPVADRIGVALNSILAIHEDSARSHLDHILQTEEIPAAVRRRMVVTVGEDEKSSAAGSASSQHRTKLTCAAITREYFEKASANGGKEPSLLEVYFEDTPWSRPLAYVRGLQMTHILGSNSSIRLNLVDSHGVVRRGDVICADSRCSKEG